MNYWLKPVDTVKAPYIAVYRIEFDTESEMELNFDFSADEHCDIFLNGKRITNGPERGSPSHWHYQRHAQILSPGKYILTARVLCLGYEFTAHAQMSLKHGFFLKAHGALSDIIDTASGNWSYQIINGLSFRKPWPDWGTFSRFDLDGYTYNWSILNGSRGKWLLAERFVDERELHEPALPLMAIESESNYKVVYLSENTDHDSPAGQFSAIKTNGLIKIKKQEQKRIIIAFDDYVCVWPEIFFSGGANAVVKMRWAESLYECKPDEFNIHNLKGFKGDRSEINGKYFVGKGNIFILPGGKKSWIDYWWQAGRYFELIIENQDENMEIKLDFQSTGYNYKFDYRLEASSADLEKSLKMALNTFQACSHETFMDCPYYEQLMYIGDVRIESLVSYIVTPDTRLTEKSLRLLTRSQQPDGMIFSRYPAKIDQVIPSFSMIYILAVHDFALWRNKPETVRELLPACRRIIAYLCGHMKDDGLLYLPGWNFIDWVAEWERGVPPGTDSGTNCTLNYLMVMTLKKAGELEKYFGSPALEEKYLSAAEIIENAVRKIYFNHEKGLFAEDKEQKYFSEHAQIIAMLADDNEKLAETFRHLELTQCGIYFSHYYLEACYKYNMDELFFRRLEKYYALEKEGLKTLPEEFVMPRSDCHAWSSHILYHYYASILGIRPTAFGFKDVQFKPMTGPLEYVRGLANSIEVEVRNGKKKVLHADVPLIDCESLFISQK